MGHAAVVSFESRKRAVWESCELDDVPCLLSVQQCGILEDILERTAPHKRLKVAMAYCELDNFCDLVQALGIINTPKELNAMTTAFSRWNTRACRMPGGMTLRLERAFGVPASLLCEGYV